MAHKTWSMKHKTEDGRKDHNESEQVKERVVYEVLKDWKYYRQGEHFIRVDDSFSYIVEDDMVSRLTRLC